MTLSSTKSLRLTYPEIYDGMKMIKRIQDRAQHGGPNLSMTQDGSRVSYQWDIRLVVLPPIWGQG
ncbi:hypothetical protein OAG37_01620 [Akkermansiaceae bacterium]|nr:hypothetical protein [Akkermansiaceae bacterium]